MTLSHIHSTLAISTPSARLGIVGDKLSAWLFVPVSLLGCTISWCVANPSVITLLGPTLFGSILQSMSPQQTWLELLHCKPVEVLVFDEHARPPNSDSPIWSLDRILCLIISFCGLRGKPPVGWQAESHRVTHAELGGISSWTGVVKVYTRQSCQVKFFHDVCFVGAPSFLANLTSDIVSGPVCKSPSHAEFDASTQLLPVGDLFCSKPRPRFKLASVFTPTKFCRQALTLKESLVAADIPLELLATAPDHTQFVLLSLMHCPVKIVSSLAQCCRIFFSLGGGRYFAPFEMSHDV